MRTVVRSLYLTIAILGLIIFAFPHPLFLEQQSAQGSETHEEESQQVFAAAMNSFELVSSLFNDVNYVKNSIYPVAVKVDSYQNAVNYLCQGFQPDLAENIAHYYLAWDEDLQKMVVIPTDSIPLITEADRKDSTIVLINDHHAVVQRIYNKCYAENDSYTYIIHLQKEDSVWKISELSLEETKREGGN